eukprot:gene12302-5976_t
MLNEIQWKDKEYTEIHSCSFTILSSIEKLGLEKKNKLLIQIVGCSKKEGLNQEHTLKYFSKLFEYLKGKEIELHLIGPDLPNELDTI